MAWAWPVSLGRAEAKHSPGSIQAWPRDKLAAGDEHGKTGLDAMLAKRSYSSWKDDPSPE